MGYGLWVMEKAFITTIYHKPLTVYCKTKFDVVKFSFTFDIILISF